MATDLANTEQYIVILKDCVSASENLAEVEKKENRKLSKENYELRQQLASLRVADQGPAVESKDKA